AEAASLLSHALDALDVQRTRLFASDEIRSRLGASFGELYEEAIALDLKLGRERAALEVLERSRARSFLDLLSKRDLTFSVDLPAPIRAEKRRLEAEQERLREEMS